MCFSSSSTTKTNQDSHSVTMPNYGQSDAFNNFMSGYNNQYTPGKFAEVQDTATVNPYTTEAAARQAGIQPVLASTMDTTSQMSRDGLTQADINRYQNPYISNVINPMMDVFNQQNRAALNNIGGKMAAQGAIRNSGANTAKNAYYGQVLPGQNLQAAQLFKDSYADAQKTALANMNAKLAAASATGQLSGAQTSANQAQFNMGDAIRNAGIQKSMIPFQLFNSGLAGQQTAGNMYGTTQDANLKGTSTTTNSPSIFDSILKAGTAIAGAVSGFPLGQSAGTSVQQGTPANGGWTTQTTPASSWWPFADGGKVVARGKAMGGGIGYSGGGSTGPDAFAQKVLQHAEAFSAFKGRQKDKARGGGIGKDVGGGIDQGYDPRLGPQVIPFSGAVDTEAMPMPPPLGERYGPEPYKPDYSGPIGAAPPPPDYKLDYADHGTVPGGTDYDPTAPARFAPTAGPAPAAPVMRPYPEPTPPRITDPRAPIKTGVYTPGGVMAEPGSWRAYGADISSLFGTLATGKDPMGSMADRRQAEIKQLMEREKDANAAQEAFDRLKANVVHYGNTDAVAAATAAREAERAPLVNLQTQVETEAKRQSVPTEAFERRSREADILGLTGTDRADYMDGKYQGNRKTPETAFETGMAGEAVKEQAERSKQIAAGKGKLQRLDQMEALINDPRVAQGPAADYYLTAQKIAIAAGVPGLTEGVAAAETFRALANQFALELRNPSSGAGMPGSMSDQDRNFLLQSTPGLTNTRQGNLLLTKLMKEQEGYNQRAKQEEMRFIQGHQSINGLSEHMDGWAAKNPMIDPRTMAAVRAEVSKAVASDPKATPAAKAAVDPNTPVVTPEDVKNGRMPKDTPFFKGTDGVVYKNPAYVDPRNAAAGIDRNPNTIYGRP